jgi:hypothetical protein
MGPTLDMDALFVSSGPFFTNRRVPLAHLLCACSHSSTVMSNKKLSGGLCAVLRQHNSRNLLIWWAAPNLA